MLSECFGDWDSVRKVRYREDILSVLSYAEKNDGADFIPDALRKYLLAGRRPRMSLILKHFKAARYSPITDLSKGSLKVTLPDTMAFFKRIGLVDFENKTVRQTQLGRELHSVWVRDEVQGVLGFLRVLLNSPYKAYRCFLSKLSETESISLPKKLAGRSTSATGFINSNGFNTDIASFYAMRDLFYELGACNWYVTDDGAETIYATSSLTRSLTNDWERTTPLDNGLVLGIWRRVDRLMFLRELKREYSRISRERFGVDVRLMKLRDDVCRRLGLSDQQFKYLLAEHVNENRLPHISLSFGTATEKRRNYALKIVTLPMVSPNRAALFIRIEKGENLD